MRQAKLIVLVVFSAVLIASVPALGDVIFTDGTFNLSNYSDSSLFESGPVTSFTPSQCSSCGDPAKAFQVAAIFGDTSTTIGNADQGFANTTLSYDPSTQGAITSITASVDKDVDISVSGPTFTFGDTFRPLIFQDGNYYLAAIAGPTNNGGDTGFLALSQSGLVASDFMEYDFATGSFVAGTPNFDGDTMLFGLAQLSSLQTTGLSSVEILATYDNLSFDLKTATPEPSGLPLCAIGITALAVTLALRRRKPANVLKGIE